MARKDGVRRRTAHQTAPREEHTEEDSEEPYHIDKLAISLFILVPLVVTIFIG